MDGLVFREIAHGSGEYAEALILRTAILRAPLGLRYVEADLAAESPYRHGAGFLEGRIVVYGQMKDSGEANWLQMKQVAVDAALQGSGIGRALVGFLEELARESGAAGLVLHARESAVGFYDRLGYFREGESFLEVGIPHWKMRKGFGPTNSA